MPGILPMKVIKVGTSAQTRIAQACDRCRSKKIRCDGFRPCCSQCSNVGFECKTSDKLSRRAFPRGYTESLEERVRALESEVRELKDLLDEKDEKIDMLSRVHSHSPRTESRRTSSIKSSTAASQVRERLASDGDDHFKVQQSPFLLQGDNSDSYFMGTSGGRMLVDSLKRRQLEYGRPSSTVSADSLFAPSPAKTSAAHATVETIASWSTPPRVISDQMVNIFFQEWAPLFPILHRPSFLSTYTQSVSGSHPVQDKKALAHLNLVYAIAALSNETSRDEAELYERQGLAALSAISMDCSMGHLQSLLLAQLYCIQKADYTRLLHYKSLAVGISQRLGLHLSQKRFALGTLTIETRKKVFWTLYTLDCFTAACLGLPKQIKDQDVECEFPVDADDENVTEKGFQPSLPGEFTKLSSALAQFRCSRILSRVLENNYPTHATHELSVKETWEFNDELQAWYEDLAPHLRLEFKQGKPGTSTISSRCPFLSLCYSYTRMLVHRPAACANISDNTASIVALASASKDAVQVLDLIRERGLSFTFAINKNELLTMTGLGLLLQSVDLDSDSKVLKDNQKHVAAVMGMLKASRARHSADFEKLASSIVSPNAPKANRDTNGSTEISPLLDSATLLPDTANRAGRSSTSTHGDKRHSSALHKKSTQPNGQPDQRLTVSTACKKPSTSPSALQKPGLQSTSAIKQSPRDSPSSVFSAPEKTRSTRSPSFNNAASSSNSMATPDTNLDFFTFPSDPVPSPKRPHCQQADPPDWDYIISALDDNSADSAADDGQVYEWPPVDEILDLTGPQESMVAQRHGRVCGSWSPKIWNSLIEVPPSAPTSQPPRSVMSLSETSLASSEEFSNVDIASTDLVT